MPATHHRTSAGHWKLGLLIYFRDEFIVVFCEASSSTHWPWLPTNIFQLCRLEHRNNADTCTETQWAACARDHPSVTGRHRFTVAGSQRCFQHRRSWRAVRPAWKPIWHLRPGSRLAEVLPIRILHYLLCRITSYRLMHCFIVYRIVSYHIVLYNNVLYRIILYHISFHFVLHRILLYGVVLVDAYGMVSYRIVSYCIILYCKL